MRCGELLVSATRSRIDCARNRDASPLITTTGPLKPPRASFYNLDGVAGAKTLGLGNILKVREARKCRFNLVSMVTNNHNDAVSASSNCGVDTPPNDGFIK